MKSEVSSWKTEVQWLNINYYEKRQPVVRTAFSEDINFAFISEDHLTLVPKLAHAGFLQQ